MQQVPERQYIEQKRLFRLAGLGPAKTVSPEIPERIAQQFDQRGRRLLPLKGRRYNRMIAADEPVAGGQPPGMPIDPAGDCG